MSQFIAELISLIRQEEVPLETFLAGVVRWRKTTEGLSRASAGAASRKISGTMI